MSSTLDWIPNSGARVPSRGALWVSSLRLRISAFGFRISTLWLLLFTLASLIPRPTFAQFLPTDVGTNVNGFQDDFNGSVLNTNWVVTGANTYSVSGGLLHVNSATSDPTHLLFELPGYDNTVQEVLARVRILSFGSGDLVRGGVGVAVDPSTSFGINYIFRDNTTDGFTTPHMALLDDMQAWGPFQSFAWQLNTCTGSAFDMNPMPRPRVG